MTVVVLPAGDVSIVADACFPLPLHLAALAALDGAPVRVPAGVLRAADLGAVVLASVRTPAGAVAWTLTLHRDDPAGRAWRHLRAVRPDLPPHMPAPWCAATPTAGMAAVLAPLFCRPGRCAM